MHWLGNDIVDLKDAANIASAANPRFAARVLSEPEQQELARQEHPGLALWAHWSAKEAAYKALKKISPELALLHRRFRVVFAADSPMANGKRLFTSVGQGCVMHGDDRIPVAWQWTCDWIHCVTSSAGTVHRIAEITHCSNEADFTDKLRDEPMSDESAAARTLAVSLLRRQGVGGAAIARKRHGKRPGPPVVVADGVPVQHCDVSLSHDGRYAAAAIRL